MDIQYYLNYPHSNQLWPTPIDSLFNVYIGKTWMFFMGHCLISVFPFYISTYFKFVIRISVKIYLDVFEQMDNFN